MKKQLFKSNMSALDYFKPTWEKNSKPMKNQSTCDEYLKRMSIKNQYGIQTHSNSYKVIVNDFALTLKNTDTIKEVKLFKDDNVVKLDPVYSNRVEFFYAPGGKKVNYSEVTSCQCIQPSKYSSDMSNKLSKIGFNEFYTVKMKNEFGVEVELCTMAIYRR